MSHDAVNMCTALGLLELVKFNDGLIDSPSARSNYALIVVVIFVVIRNGTLAIFSECNLQTLPDITLYGNVGMFYRTADQITGLSGQFPGIWQP